MQILLGVTGGVITEHLWRWLGTAGGSGGCRAAGAFRCRGGGRGRGGGRRAPGRVAWGQRKVLGAGVPPAQPPAPACPRGSLRAGQGREGFSCFRKFTFFLPQNGRLPSSSCGRSSETKHFGGASTKVWRSPRRGAGAPGGGRARCCPRPAPSSGVPRDAQSSAQSRVS